MNRSFTSTLLFSFFIFITISTHAQRSSQGSGKGESYTVVGKVTDESGEKPLEYATVSLIRQKDSVAVSGIVTNAKGGFELAAPGGSYFLQVTFLGFDPQRFSDIILSPEKPFIRIKDIRLAEQSTTLDEVEIVADKSRMEFSLDKKVFNVGQDLANNGGTVSDLLDNIPSVSVDIEGEISVRGSSGVRILINGKPSGFANNSADAFKQMPAGMIEKVEIITNPSARYEAEGTAGILNIVLKEERQRGWNGSLNVTAGYPQSHNASVTVNRREDKLNLFASVGLRYRDTPRNSLQTRDNTLNPDPFLPSFEEQISKRQRGGLSGNVRLGADYNFDKNTTLTGSILYRKSDDFNNGIIEYNYFNEFSVLDSANIRDNQEDEDEYSLDYSLNFERRFARKGHKLTADLIFTSEQETEAMDAIEQKLNGYSQPKTQDLLQEVRNSELSDELTLKVDYIYPFKKDGKFELGYRGSIRNIDNVYKVQDFNYELADWKTRIDLSNDFQYDEEIHAAYAIFGDKFNKFSYQLGLRAEYTHVQTLLEETKETNDKEYANLFPSAFLNYELSTGNSVQLSYSRRLRRPRFHDLNPFFTYANPRNIRSGNPNLDPEFTHAAELGYIKYWETVTLSSSIYYRHTNGDISRISSIDSLGITLSRPENIATRDDLGVEFSLDISPFKWWDVTLSSNVYYGELNGENLGFAQQTDFFSFTSRLNTKLALNNDLDIQVMVNYRGAEANIQGSRRDVLYTNVGISKDILKKKATISFRMSDLFNTSRYRYENTLNGSVIYGEGNWRNIRQVFVGFSYRLNQKKRRQRESNDNFDGDGEF